MALSSMTGFARTPGSLGALTWTWELRSVNGKTLDVRLRLPPGCERLELPARNAVASVVKRGTVHVSLNITDGGESAPVKVNEAVLAEIVRIAVDLQKKLGSAPVQPELLLGLRGVLETGDQTLSEEQTQARDAAMFASLKHAVAALAVSRTEEGARLSKLLDQQLAQIETLWKAACDNPSRSAEAIRVRLKEQVARLMETGSGFDAERLHQEAVLLATKADIQEELDRLSSHVEAARILLGSTEPVGRKFDFLAQEFNREANTLCSKANDKSLTSTGLELKTVIDQMREQVQNIE